MAQRQTVTAEERDRAMGFTPETVQCDGCPAGTYVIRGRPGHMDDCGECSRHCCCFKDTLGAGPHNGNDEF